MDNKWISVSDKLPKKNKWVLCYCEDNIYQVCKYVRDILRCGYLFSNKYGKYQVVTHWQPLPPKPPKETNNEKL